MHVTSVFCVCHENGLDQHRKTEMMGEKVTARNGVKTSNVFGFISGSWVAVVFPRNFKIWQ